MSDDPHLLRALTEWRDARQAVLDASHPTCQIPTTSDMLGRLGNAEDALMKIARGADPSGEMLTWYEVDGFLPFAWLLPALPPEK